MVAFSTIAVALSAAAGTFAAAASAASDAAATLNVPAAAPPPGDPLPPRATGWRPAPPRLGRIPQVVYREQVPA